MVVGSNAVAVTKTSKLEIKKDVDYDYKILPEFLYLLCDNAWLF